MDDFKKYIQQHRDQLDLDEPSADLWEKIERDLKPQEGKVISIATFIKFAVAACVILLAGFGAYYLAINNVSDQRIAQATAPVQTNTEKEIKVQPQEQALITEQPRSFRQSQSIGGEEKRARKEINAPASKEEIGKNKARSSSTNQEQDVNPTTKAFTDMEASYTSMINMQLERIKGTPIYVEDASYFHVFKKQFQDLNNDEKVLKEETKRNGINEDIITRMINIYQEKIYLLKQLQSEINKMNNRAKNSTEDVQQKVPSFINL